MLIDDPYNPYTVRTNQRTGIPMIGIGYYRISSQAHDVPGLGIEGQQAAAEACCNSTGAELKQAYTEVESGRSRERPALEKALAHARRIGGTLVVAKLDRLARNVPFLSAIMESNVPFLACDQPLVTPSTISALIAVAKAATSARSRRTYAGLMALKAKGILLGSARPGHWIGNEDARRRGAAEGNRRSTITIKRATRAAFIGLVPQVLALRKQKVSMGKIAARLNEDGHVSRRGTPWNARQVMVLIQRAKVWMAETTAETGGAV